jgi:glycosyltransferase involved in cell wall biosynthesis
MDNVIPRGLYLEVYPAVLDIAPRMAKIAASIHATGHFVETQLVSVAAPGLSTREEFSPGVQMTRVAGSTRRGNLGRALRAALWQPRVYLHFRRADVAMIAAHNVWVLPLCWLLAQRTGARLIYNAHELETETIAMSGAKQRVAKWVERALIRRCSMVSVVNESIADWYAATYPALARPAVVGNVPVVVDAEVGLRERLGVSDDELLFVHTGHLVDGRNIPLILAAFEDSPHHVVFLGDGPFRESVLAARSRAANIHWLAPVAPDLLVAHVRECDVGLCLIEEQAGLSDRLSSPNKLMEALAAGIPPLCSNLVEARRLLKATGDTWILTDPPSMLRPALERLTKADVARFRSSWNGVPSWDEDVVDVVARVNRLMAPTLR